MLLTAALARAVFRCLALTVLLALCVQMAVCITTDHCLSDTGENSRAHTGSDCGCHDCACCSLHLGFPLEAHAFAVSLTETVGPTPGPRITDIAGARLEHPPRA